VLSPVNGTVADAVRGAYAVGYALWVGTSAQEADSGQYLQVREDAQRLGMLLIVWAGSASVAVAAPERPDRSPLGIPCAQPPAVKRPPGQSLAPQ